MYLLVGLGNPGNQYEKTRHNVGWIVLHNLFPNTDWKENKYAKCIETHEEISDTVIHAIKPQTFMNESGISLEYFVQKEGIDPQNIIVIYDDIDLPLGKIKISFDRGSGGHNGIKSIEEHLGSREFIRIRIGISRLLENGELIKPNVLGHFESSEFETLKKVSETVESILKTIFKEGKEKAMTKFN